MQVLISVHKDTPVRENSRANIQSLGLTGGERHSDQCRHARLAVSRCHLRDPDPRHPGRSGPGARSVRRGARGDEQRQCPVDATQRSRGREPGIDPQDGHQYRERHRACWTSRKTISLRPSPTSGTAPNSFKNLSGKLEVSLGDNVDGLTKTAKDSLSGIRQFHARRASRTAVTLNRILEKFEADPKGFLLGGNQVPEYTPRGQ